MAAKKTVKVPEVSATSKTVEAQVQTRQVAATNAVQGLKGADVVRKIGDLGLAIQSNLDQVKNLTMESLKEYTDLQDAIQFATSKLEELRGKEATAISLAELLAEHEAKVAEFSAEDAARAERIAKEDAEREARLVQEAANLQVERVREADTYKYNRDRTRRNEEGEYAQKLDERNRQNAATQAAKEAMWAEREALLAKKEVEYKAAIDANAQIPQLIDSAVKKEVAIVTNTLTREHKHALELLNAENRNKLGLLEQQVLSNGKTIELLEAQLAAANEKLAASEKRVEAIAVNAMQSASGRQALEAVQQNIATSASAVRTSK